MLSALRKQWGHTPMDDNQLADEAYEHAARTLIRDLGYVMLMFLIGCVVISTYFLI